MGYYIAKADTLEKIIDLNMKSMSTVDYINLKNQYFQLITGEYILLSDKESRPTSSQTSSSVSFFGCDCDHDDEYGDETTGWGGPVITYEDEDDEYGDETTGWGF